MCGRLREVAPLHPLGTRIPWGRYAWLLIEIIATFFEVDCGEDPWLHEHNLFSLALRGDHSVSHPSVDVDLAFRQLNSPRITISISRLISTSWSRYLLPERPLVILPRNRVPNPSELVFSCLFGRWSTLLFWSESSSECNWSLYNNNIIAFPSTHPELQIEKRRPCFLTFDSLC